MSTRQWPTAFAALTIVTAVGAGSAQVARPGTAGVGEVRRGAVRLTFLGNAGWEITDGKTVVLIDPYLSGPSRPSGVDPIRIPDSTAIDAHVPAANYVLVTHGHSDHALDATYIARTRGAIIIGNGTVANLARAYGVPDSSLITVRGGEDYEFGAFSLRVIPSIHSALLNKRYYNTALAGEAPSGLRGPLHQSAFVEGASLAYLLRIGGQQVLIMGSMNFIEREMEGLRPTIALVGANGSRREIHDYAGRLMRALGFPSLVLPTHCCFSVTDPNALAFAAEVKAASPSSRVVIPEVFAPIRIPGQ